MSTLDNTIKEIRKAMMSNSEKEYFELSRTALNYLINSLQKYRTIEVRMTKMTENASKGAKLFTGDKLDF